MRKVRNILVKALRSKEKQYKMEYGSAFHKFAPVWHTEGNLAKGISLAVKYYMNPEIHIPEGDFRNVAHLINTCTFYSKKYPFGKDPITVLRNAVTKEFCVEHKFRFPFLVIDGIEFIICGTIDMLGLYFGEPCVIDHKSTAAWNQREYLEGYQLNSQLKMYKYVCSRLAEMFPATFGSFKNVGCMINGIFISDKGALFQRSRVFDYSEDEMQEFLENLKEFCRRIAVCYRSNVWRRNDTSCQGQFGPCDFLQACSAPDEECEGLYLEEGFTAGEFYNPMMFGE